MSFWKTHRIGFYVLLIVKISHHCIEVVFVMAKMIVVMVLMKSLKYVMVNEMHACLKLIDSYKLLETFQNTSSISLIVTQVLKVAIQNLVLL